MLLKQSALQEQNLEATKEIEFDFGGIPDVLALIDSGAFLQTLHIASVFQALRMRRLFVLNTTPLPGA